MQCASNLGWCGDPSMLCKQCRHRQERLTQDWGMGSAPKAAPARMVMGYSAARSAKAASAKITDVVRPAPTKNSGRGVPRSCSIRSGTYLQKYDMLRNVHLKLKFIASTGICILGRQQNQTYKHLVKDFSTNTYVSRKRLSKSIHASAAIYRSWIFSGQTDYRHTLLPLCTVLSLKCSSEWPGNLMPGVSLVFVAAIPQCNDRMLICGN